MASPVGAPAVPPLCTVTLANGLTVLVLEEHTVPIASVWCWYRVGSADEREGRTGVSHWVEHMNFKGTTHIPREAVKGIIERFGGTWNGYTWVDQTAYVQTAGRDALDQMLWIEAERMGHCLYDPADCESERTVILSELDGSDNDPAQRLDQAVTSAAFTVHPYRHPTIGWRGDLCAMTRDDLVSHYRRFYVPNNATLVVVGDVDASDVVARVTRHFGAFAPGVVPPRARAGEPVQEGLRRVRLQTVDTTAYLQCAWRAPAVSDPDFVPALLLDAVLTGAKGVNLWSSPEAAVPQRRARLYRALVDTGRAVSVHGALWPTADPFLYSIGMTIADGGALADVEAHALSVIDDVVQRGVSEEELTRAARQLRAQLVFDQDSVTNVAHQLGYFTTVDALDVFLSLVERIAAVTVADVQRVATTLLSPSRLTIGWSEPQR